MFYPCRQIIYWIGGATGFPVIIIQKVPLYKREPWALFETGNNCLWLSMGAWVYGVRFVQVLAKEAFAQLLFDGRNWERSVEGDNLTSPAKLSRLIYLYRSWRDGFMQPPQVPTHPSYLVPFQNFLSFPSL